MPRNNAQASTDPSAFIETFNRLVSAERKTYPRLTRQQAIARVARREPVLHQKYLVATNPNAAWGIA